MRATITLLVVVVVVVASQEPSPGHPPCQAYTTRNTKRIPVPDDLKELDLWFSFQERECEVEIAVVTNGEQSGPLKVNIKQRTLTQKSHNWYSSSSDDEENTSWCRVRLTQAVEGVKHSKLSAAGQCGNNRKKEEQYTDDDVTELLVKTNNNIVFNVCPVPPPPVCPTGAPTNRGNSHSEETPKCNPQQCRTVCPDLPPESDIPNCSTACPDQQQQQQQQQQGATVVLGVLLGVCLLACVALATANCYNKASFRDMMARSPFQLSTSKQFLWPSRGTNNQSANQDATQGANRDATQDANQGANQDANQGATQDATQGANQGARPGGRASAHDSENSLYGATIDRQ